MHLSFTDIPEWIKWLFGGAGVAIFSIAGRLIWVLIYKKDPTNNSTDTQRQSGRGNVQAGDNTSVHYHGISLQEYEEGLRRREAEVRKELKEAQQLSETKRHQLEAELQATKTKLSNLQVSYEEKIKRLQEAEAALENYKGEIPEDLHARAMKSLHKGDTRAAEESFDRIAEKEKNNAAEAYYQSGQLAESRLDYDKAMRQFTTAVTLANNEPRYLNAAGVMAINLANYARAEEWLTRLVEIRKSQGENTDYATALNNLASLYQSQGKYDEAEPIQKRTLAILEKALGDEHPKVATCLNNLAALYQSQGKFDEAEPIQKRALAIAEKALGDEHPDVATGLNNLAGLYDSQGKYGEAEPIYKQALAIREKALGDQHPNVATSLNNLAELYRSQGKFGKAEPLLKRALTIREKALGDQHPDVAQSLNNLAGLYESQGKYGEAEPIFKRALTIREKALGDQHPDVATSLNNLAYLYKTQGKYDEAEPLYQRALKILRKCFPGGHPNIDRVEKNYQIMLQEMKNAKK